MQWEIKINDFPNSIDPKTAFSLGIFEKYLKNQCK